MRPIVFTLLSFTPIHPHQHDLSVYHGLAGDRALDDRNIATRQMHQHGRDRHRRDEAYLARGVRFVEEPRRESYGTVAVFEDLYGNRWDLIEPRRP